SEWPIAWRQQSELGSRETFVAYWAVEAMAERIGALPDTKPYLRPRLNPTIELHDDGTAYFAGQDSRRRLPADWFAALRVIDGKATIAELNRLGFGEVLDELAAKGLVRVGIELSVTSVRPFDDLLAFVQTLPASSAIGPWRN